MAQKSLPIGVYSLASALICVKTGFNSCVPLKSLPNYPSERAGVFTRLETAVALKVYRRSGFLSIVAQWRDYFHSVQPSRREMYNLRQRHGEHGTV
jgi:hypothetical protein